jgi:ubiquinone/menaquinone biosynthesis C-methylase UbiE
MNRLAYQAQQVRGRIINIGCGDLPINFGPDSVNVDIDWWDVSNFVHCDCIKLPFDNKSFDTAVLGDILEHCVDPVAAIQEAARVAKRLVLTVPEDTRLPFVGQHLEAGLRDRAVAYRVQHGYSDDMTDEEVVIAHKKTCSHFIKAYPESEIPHDGHINRFDESDIQHLIKTTGMTVVDYQKIPEITPGLTWMNWLITLED